MNRGAWWATVYGVTKELGMTQQLNSNNNRVREGDRTIETEIGEKEKPEDATGLALKM